MSSAATKTTRVPGKFTLTTRRNVARSSTTVRAARTADEILAAAHRHVINNSFLVVLPHNGLPVITTMKISSFRTQLITALREALAFRNTGVPLKPFLENDKFNWAAGMAASMLKAGDEELLIWPSMGIVSTMAMMTHQGSAEAWAKYGKLRNELLTKCGFVPRVNPTWLPAGLADAQGSGAVMRLTEAIGGSDSGIQQLCTFCANLFLGLSYERLASKIASNGSANLSDFNKFASKFISGETVAGTKSGVTGSYTTLLRLYKSCIDFGRANAVATDRKDRKIVVFDVTSGHPSAHSRSYPTETSIGPNSKNDQVPTVGSVATMRTTSESGLFSLFRQRLVEKLQEENRADENKIAITDADIDLFLTILHLGKITIENLATNSEDVYASYMMTKSGTSFSAGLRPIIYVFAKHYGMADFALKMKEESLLSTFGQRIVAEVESAPPKVSKSKASTVQPLNSAAMDASAFAMMQNKIRQDGERRAAAAIDAVQRRAASPGRTSPLGRASPSRADVFANGFRASAGVSAPAAQMQTSVFAAQAQANVFAPAAQANVFAAAPVAQANPFAAAPAAPANPFRASAGLAASSVAAPANPFAAASPVADVSAQLTQLARQSAGQAQRERESAALAATQAAALRASAERREQQARLLGSAAAAVSAAEVAPVNPFVAAAPLNRSSGAADPLRGTSAGLGGSPFGF